MVTTLLGDGASAVAIVAALYAVGRKVLAVRDELRDFRQDIARLFSASDATRRVQAAQGARLDQVEAELRSRRRDQR